MSDETPATPQSWAIPSPSAAQSAPPLDPAGVAAASPAATRPAPPWRRAGLVAAAVGAAGVLVAGGYLAGVALSQGSHSTTLTSAQGAAADDSGRAAAGQGVPGAQGGLGGPGGPGGHGDGDLAASGMTAGVITSVKGDTLALQTRQGSAVTVHTSDATTVRGASATSVGDLAVGDVILVAGTRADDGSITAAQILTGPSGDGDRLAPNGTTPGGTTSGGSDDTAVTGDQVGRVTT